MFCPDCGSWNRAEAARCLRCGIHMPENSDKRQGPPDPSVTALRQVTGGRYTIMHRVGEGGMASVYYAINVCLDSPVVIKVLHPHLAREHEMREPPLRLPHRHPPSVASQSRRPGLEGVSGSLPRARRSSFGRLHLQGLRAS